MKRAHLLTYWTIPSLVCLAVYWPGLWAWFQQDDFAWLGLGASVHDPSTLLRALFAPMAQGTIRPLSERAFFMIFHAVFGLWATPYRVVVFLTQFANLMLLGFLAQRVTGSRLAGFLAPTLWAVNGGLAIAMSWTSAYNQVLCGFFLLLALCCFARYTETGDRRYLAAQWVAFLLGFGALEINAVYPALAAAYALCFARPYLRKTWPLFLVSAGYALLHYWVAPVRTSNPAYGLHFDASILGTLWTYWQWALGPARLEQVIDGIPRWIGIAGTVLLTVPLAWFVAWKASQRQWAVLFPLAWFVVVLLPVLPLRDHISSYYLTLPTAGLALLAAWALTGAPKKARFVRTLALLLALVYVGAGIAGGRTAARKLAARSYGARTLVWGVVRARQLHPDKAIVLARLDPDLFWAGVADRPFRLVGITDVYMAPEAAPEIARHPERGDLSDLVIPTGVLMDLLARNRAVVYTEDAGRLRAVTLSYLADARRRRWIVEEPRRVDVGQPSFARQLGPAWYELDSGHRWMPRRATVWLGGPRTSSERLYVSGYCPAPQVVDRPLRVSVGVEARLLQTFHISRGDAPFSLVLKLPPELVGKERVEVFVEADRTFTPPPDLRELGLVFGTFEIRQ